MARKPRLHYPGALYHVILRGNARQDIFFSDQDRCRFLLLTQEGLERYDHRVLAFCLLTNHVHLAIQVGQIPLSRILQNLSFRYTRWINQRRDRSGHLFQGRHKAVLVDADSHLLELVAYLHLNPVRVGMAKNPEEYPWSSHRAYLGLEVIPWLGSDFVLGCFSTELPQARRRFAEFVSERIPDGHQEQFHGKGSADTRIFGEDRFVENVLMQAEPLPERKPSLDGILDAVARIYGLRKEELAAPGQQRRPSEARGLAAWAVLNLSEASLKDLAVRMGRDLSTMSAAARQFEIRSRDEVRLQKEVERLKKEVQLSIFKA